MSNAGAIRLASLIALLGVLLGAFGAHGLKDVLARNATAGMWERATFYHLVHALMLFILLTRGNSVGGPWFFFFTGIILFSGSLYLLALTKWHWLGAITPLGGLAFIAGWSWLLINPRKLFQPVNSVAEKD